MKRIIIIGNSGSGKTWLGKKLASILGLTYILLDSIFWEPGGHNQKRIDSDVEADIKSIQTLEGWVIEGVFGHIVEYFITLADTLIYINLPWDECRNNLLNRGSESSRQLVPIKAEENFQSLLIWTSEYETRESKASKRYHNFLFESFSGQKHMIFNREEMNQLIEIINNLPLNDRLMKHSMDKFTSEELQAALRPIASLISKCEKAQQKLRHATWQHTMLKDNLKALHYAYALMSKNNDTERFTRDDLLEALRSLTSMIDITEKTQAKFLPGTSHYSLQRNRLHALLIAEALIKDELDKC